MPPEALRHPLAILAIIFITAALTLELRHRLQEWRRRKLFTRARLLEQRAVALLAAAGFETLAAQLEREGFVLIDGVPRTYKVRADYLVRDAEGRRYVAEVKSGAKAPNPLQTDTRRQLLEYQLLYREAEGLLLVDMNAGQILRVRFTLPP